MQVGRLARELAPIQSLQRSLFRIAVRQLKMDGERKRETENSVKVQWSKQKDAPDGQALLFHITLLCLSSSKLLTHLVLGTHHFNLI